MSEQPPRSPRLDALRGIEEVERGEAIKAKIYAAASFEELYAVLREIGKVPGGDKEYTAEDLIAKIERLRKGGGHIDSITRTYDLRAKVQALVIQKRGGEKEK